MNDDNGEVSIRNRLVNGLHTEAMLLADEARAYFDQAGRDHREMLDPVMRVTLSCESLKITTRLMHILAWLLTERALAVGQMNEGEAAASSRRLGEAAATDPGDVAGLPAQALTLIEASQDLYARVRRLAVNEEQAPTALSPVLGLLDRLQRAF